MSLAVAVAVGLLVYGAVSDLVIGDHLYTVRNLVAAGLLVVLARARQLSWSDIGLAPDRLGEGLRWGAGAVLLAAVVVAAGAALADRVPLIATLLADQRAVLDEGGLAHHTLVRIPLGTAFFEELAFRGVLLALLLAATSTTAGAVLWSAAVFGLWHISSTIMTLRINEAAVASGAGLAAIAGGVAFTALAGVVFAVLRLGSGSLLAPVLAHWATNAFGLLAAATVQRTGGA